MRTFAIFMTSIIRGDVFLLHCGALPRTSVVVVVVVVHVHDTIVVVVGVAAGVVRLVVIVASVFVGRRRIAKRGERAVACASNALCAVAISAMKCY